MSYDPTKASINLSGSAAGVDLALRGGDAGYAVATVNNQNGPIGEAQFELGADFATVRCQQSANCKFVVVEGGVQVYPAP